MRKEATMTDEEKKRMEHLERVESAARAVVNSFSNSIDYNTWDSALDALEVVLKEKP
jgi:hypothetical protein